MKSKLLILLLVFFLFVQPAYCQSLGINYQGVARNSDGSPVADKDIAIRIDILYGSSSGTLAYRETHSVTTNQFGLFAIVIGKGSPEVNTFSSIDWMQTVIWMMVEMDTDAGTNYVMVGSQQLQAVPFAKYAEVTELNAGNGIQIDGNMITNTAPDKTITMAGAGTATVTGTYPNFLVTGNAQDLTLTNDELKITGNPNASPIDLLPYKQTLGVTNSGTLNDISITAGNTIQVDIADNDNDPTNEIQDLSTVPALGTAREVAISGSNSVQFDVADNDNDATNEIQDLQGVLAQSNDAGGGTITNLADPANATEVATMNYVDEGDKDYAFKAVLNFSTSGTAGEQITFSSLEINQSTVVASNTFTAPVDGVYLFVLQSTAAADLSIIARKTSGMTSDDYTFQIIQTYPTASIRSYFGSALWQLSAGDTIELLNNSGTGTLTGTFFGYKL